MKALQNLLEPAKRQEEQPTGTHLAGLSLVALGIVYGDIGTSPLYAVRECFRGDRHIALGEANVLGALSLIVWSLIIVISIKYVLYVMRADNRGEGGILALMALLYPDEEKSGRGARWLLVAMGLFGAALLYGDGTITPAISVLSAVEGIEVATPGFQPYVIPVTIVILCALFMFQRRGTAGIGAVFGPVMLVWFATIASLGVGGIARHPAVLQAVAPWHAVRFFVDNGWAGFVVLGAVFLVVTGGEALYADVGHFGAKPIRLAWFGVVLPALLLNYFGQGALLLERPAAVRNPFYMLAPSWATYPLVALATAATVIASQAVISGAFSLTRQAIQLGYCPRLRTEHTSSEEIGQVYLPGVNWALMVATIGLVLGFRHSGNLAAAYGVAVSTTMVITTVLSYFVARELWEWSSWLAALVTGLFLTVDLAFFTANMTKVEQGGWFPLAVAAAVYTTMSTWNKGRKLLQRRLMEREVPLEEFVADLEKEPPHRVEGVAVFLTGVLRGTPTALVQQLRHNKAVHEKVVVLTVISRNQPYVALAENLRVKDLGQGFFRVLAGSGFMQDPDVPRILRACAGEGLEIDISSATFYVGRVVVIPSRRHGMRLWRARLFAFMSRNSQPATAFFRLPRERVLDLGMEVEY